ncbi:MAG: serine/threonine protein phosphatase [Deltaproteobacteria bacterium]|nr:serine/threonine protein phosphatase [Deltaproteobacteria bacterium]
MAQERLTNIKRFLAIGDIHGCSVAFEALLEAVNPGQDDLLIMLGDYIDRGPESEKVVERLITLPGETNLVALAGNHEEMILAWRDKNNNETLNWWANGGLNTLKSYCHGDERWLLKMFWESFLASQTKEFHAAACELIPRPHWEFFEKCIDWFETDEHIFVHGLVNPALDLVRQPPHVLRWARFHREIRPHKSGKKVICAHTAQANGLPADIGHAVCIDTYLYGGQWLTCLDVYNSKYYQANYLGEIRIIE